MSLFPLLALFDHLPGFQRLIQNIESGVKKQRVPQFPSSFKAYLLAGIYHKNPRPLLVITPTQQGAEELKEDLTLFIQQESSTQQFSKEGQGGEDGKDECQKVRSYGEEATKVALFPSWEILPYEPLSSHYELTALRLSVLDKLRRGEDLIVIAPVGTILSKIIPPQALFDSKLELITGQSLDREEFLAKLLTLGYERIEMVEAKGEFSVRGGIVDVYPITSPEPIRIDFLGETIESIRSFSPTSQRSTGIKDRVVILPKRELVLTQEALSRFKAKISSPESLINSSLTEGYFEGIEWYLPSFYPELASIFNYLKEDSLIFLDGPDLIIEEVAKIEDEISSRYQETISRGKFVLPPKELLLSWREAETLMDKFQVISTPYLSDKETDRSVKFSVSSIEGLTISSSLFVQQLGLWQDEGWQIIFVAGYQAQAARIQELLKEIGIESTIGLERLDHLPSIITGHLSKGFELKDLRLAVISDRDLFPKPRSFRRRYFDSEESFPISDFVDLKEGDLVVHLNYGIGRYLGLKNIKVEGTRRDFLLIEYAEGDRLYIPIDQLSLVQKYIGDRDSPPKIYRLGGNAWEQVKRRVKNSVRDLAKELLGLYAARETLPGYAFPPDTSWQYEFEARFRHEETLDQLRAVEEIKQDLEKKRPMDRLVCGDVGYGKTEVAIRAAFKVTMDAKQVAVLVPTTILAQQHLATFRDRFDPYPVNIEVLSRFKTKTQQKKIVERLKKGEIDIIIGTHRLLQKDVSFRNLGLVIIDEEQRFGVRHKEKLKNLRKLVDVLTLTATPIPRTLYMALTKTRDMSVIQTPPPDRLPIQTQVAKFDEDLIHDAILREKDRGGQVFFVHNRIQTIDKMAALLRKIVPEIRLTIAHGQMPEHELERVMLDFLDGRYDLLLSTSIIESGLDIPQVNTIIIADAHKFGLAQLYQLRGRVGRAGHRAYAYLLYPTKAALSDQAKERLLAIKEFSELGSGFRLAMRDMEIRGTGNILGPEQHGELVSVGFELYCRLLEEAVAELKGEKIEREVPPPQVDLPLEAYLPEDYIPDTRQRFEAYKKIASVKSIEDLKEIEEEFWDRYGPFPKVTQNLLIIMELKALARVISIPSISGGDGRINIELPQKEEIIPKIQHLAKRFSDKIRFNPRKTNLLHLEWDKTHQEGQIQVLREILKELADEPR